MKVSKLDDLTAEELTPEYLFDTETKNADILEGVESKENENTMSDNTKSLAQPTANKKPTSKSTGKKKR